MTVKSHKLKSVILLSMLLLARVHCLILEGETVTLHKLLKSKRISEANSRSLKIEYKACGKDSDCKNKILKHGVKRFLNDDIYSPLKDSSYGKKIAMHVVIAALMTFLLFEAPIWSALLLTIGVFTGLLGFILKKTEDRRLVVDNEISDATVAQMIQQNQVSEVINTEMKNLIKFVKSGNYGLNKKKLTERKLFYIVKNYFKTQYNVDNQKTNDQIRRYSHTIFEKKKQLMGMLNNLLKR